MVSTTGYGNSKLHFYVPFSFEWWKKNVDIKISKFDQNKRYSEKKLYPIVNIAYGTVTRLHVNGNGVCRPISLLCILI